MTTGAPNHRSVFGWICIGTGKIGSLLLLWRLLTGSDAPSPGTVGGDRSLLSSVGVMPLFAATVGAVAIGFWLLPGSERSPRADGP